MRLDTAKITSKSIGFFFFLSKIFFLCILDISINEKMLIKIVAYKHSNNATNSLDFFKRSMCNGAWL